MSDIVERLRRKVFKNPQVGAPHERTVEWQAADEIERLREALRQCYVLFNDARNGPPNLFKICCEGMRVVRAENVLGRDNG